MPRLGVGLAWKLHLIRLIGLGTEAADALAWPGRGRVEGGVWHFPREGMPPRSRQLAQMASSLQAVTDDAADAYQAHWPRQQWH